MRIDTNRLRSAIGDGARNLFRLLLKKKGLILAFAILLIPLMAYLLPCPVNFNGEIRAYDITWRTTKGLSDADIFFIHEMPATSIQVKGADRISGIGYESSGDPGRILNFDGPRKLYSIRNLKVPGAAEFGIHILRKTSSMDDSGTGSPLLLLTMRLLNRNSAGDISFLVINGNPGDETLRFTEGGREKMVCGRDLKVRGRSIELTAYLVEDGRGDVFAFPPLSVSPGSMKFEAGKGRIVSSIAGGYLQPQLSPEPIQITQDRSHLILGPPGILRLLDLTVAKADEKKDGLGEDNYLIARFEGQSSRVETGMSLDSTSTHRFSLLNRYLTPKQITWLMTAILPILIGLPGFYLQQWWKNKLDGKRGKLMLCLLISVAATLCRPGSSATAEPLGSSNSLSEAAPHNPSEDVSRPILNIVHRGGEFIINQLDVYACAEEAETTRPGKGRGADRSGQNLQESKWSSRNLANARFVESKLERADFSHADLRFAFLSGALLDHAVLRDANLSGANLQGTSLKGADLEYVELFDGDVLSSFPVSFFFEACPSITLDFVVLPDGTYIDHLRLEGCSGRAFVTFLLLEGNGANVEGADFSGATGLNDENVEYICRWGGARTRQTLGKRCRQISPQRENPYWAVITNTATPED